MVKINMKRVDKERKAFAMEKFHLRKNLKSIVIEILALTTKDEAIELVRAAKDIPDIVRKIAYQLRSESCSENPYQISILGALSDLALKRMTPLEKKLSLETPEQILHWFALYLERVLDKRDLRLIQENKVGHEINFGTAEIGGCNPFEVESMRASSQHHFPTLRT